MRGLNVIMKRKTNFEKTADEWLEYKRNAVKESTYYEYMRIVENYLKPAFRNTNIEKITDINRYIDSLNKKLRPKTIREIISVLKAIIEYYEEEYDCKIKLKKYKLPKVGRSKVEVFSNMELTKLEKYCFQENNLKTLGIMIALNTGLRIGEICALQWKDIDLVEKKIFVKKTVERIYDSKGRKSKLVILMPKTEHSERMVPISSKLYEMLKTFKKKYDENDYVLSGGKRIVEPRCYQNVFYKILKINGINHRKFHCIRHTFATNCVEVGMDIKSLSEILGHANVNITLNTYVHSSDKLKRKYLEKI